MISGFFSICYCTVQHLTNQMVTFSILYIFLQRRMAVFYILRYVNELKSDDMIDIVFLNV